MFKNPYHDLSALTDRGCERLSRIWIEPTNRCNTKCVHCAHYYADFGADMSRGVYEKVRDQVLDGGVDFVELVGYGEPLWAELFDEMFEDCRNRAVPLRVITNGLLLNSDDAVRRFLDTDCIVTLSLDGARAETFERVRPHIKWSAMVKRLERIGRLVDEAGAARNCRFEINFVAMRHNITDLPDLVRLASQYLFQSINVLPMLHDGERSELVDQSLHDAAEWVTPAYVEALRRARRLGVQLCLPQSFLDQMIHRPGPFGRPAPWWRRWARSIRYGWLAMGGYHQTLSWKMERILHWPPPRGKTGIRYCPTPWTDAYFEASGQVRACCMIHDVYGDLTKENWSDLWNGRLWRSLRRTVHGWNPTRFCRRCGGITGINGGDEHLYEAQMARYRSECVSLDSEDVRWSDGFYDREILPDGQSHIWMRRQGTFRLRRRRGAALIRLSIASNLPDQIINTGACRVDGGEAQYFDDTCPTIVFERSTGTGDWVEFVIEMECAYDSGDDPRELALSVQGVEWLF